MKDPIVRNGFFCVSRKKLCLDWITEKGFGPSWSYRQRCFAVPPRESDYWPAEDALSSRMVSFRLLESAVLSEASHIKAERGLDFHLSHSQQTLKGMTQIATALNGSTSATPPLFQTFIGSFQTMENRHAYHPTSKETHHLWLTHRAGLPQITSVLFFMLSLLKSLVDFVLWLAISKVQS